jgi:hypothetical protein
LNTVYALEERDLALDVVAVRVGLLLGVAVGEDDQSRPAETVGGGRGDVSAGAAANGRRCAGPSTPRTRPLLQAT